MEETAEEPVLEKDEHDEEWHREHDIVCYGRVELPPLGELYG